MKKLLLILAVVSLTFAQTGCAKLNKPSEEQDEKVIYTTIYPIKFIAEYLAKEYVDVRSIYESQQDIHHYEPSIGTIMAMSQADMIIYNHIGGEREIVKKVLDNAKDKNLTVIDVSQGIDLLEALPTDDHDEDHHELYENDEHFWIDPIRMIVMATTIKDALILQFPDKKDKIEERYVELKAQLAQLDAEYTKVIQESELDTIIVTHAAFGYWSKYGLKQISLTGLHNDEPKTQNDLIDIIEFAKQKGIKTILKEPLIENKTVDTVANEINASLLEIHDLSSLSSNDLESGRNYFTIMKDNLANLKIALNPSSIENTEE